MADKFIQMTQRNTANTDWDNLYPLNKFETAGGTATAITLTIPSLVDGVSKTFVASANNNGASTTINGKNLYKPNTTTAPNLIAGKAYSVWYNSSGDCFFIKASAEGDVTVADVLAGKIFSNGDDTGLTGTLALTGTATINDVVNGKTFYNTDAKTILTGTFSNIKSIQRGTATVLGFTTVTIASVNTNNSIVRVSYVPPSGTDPSKGMVVGDLTDSTTVTLSPGYSGYSVTVAWEVIEFNNVKSIQRGSKSLSSTSGTVTVASVNINKAMLFICIKNLDTNVPFTYPNGIINPILTNSTTITFSQLGTNWFNIYWQLIEFN